MCSVWEESLLFFQIGRIVEDSEAVTEVLSNAELLKQVVCCIGGENLSVAKAVSSRELSATVRRWFPQVGREA